MRICTLVLACLFLATNGKTTKKDVESDNGKKLEKKAPSAIVAIEIVDPSGKTKTSKRTIESSLGYGYQSFTTHQQPKYEVYKYSQHDIPPASHHLREVYNRKFGHGGGGGGRGGNFHVQKSVSYTLPTQKYTIPVSAYQPGTTYYSTVDQQGQVGHLSTEVPQRHYESNPQVPVIILRVYPNQLSDPSQALYPNLPQSHPLAHNINSIDIQSLLSNYVSKMLQHYQTQAQPQSQPQPQYEQVYNTQKYVQPSYQYIPQPQVYQQEEKQELLTHENYPDDAHTRVIFKTQKGHVKTTAKQVDPPQVPHKTIRIHVPESISDVQVEAQTESGGQQQQQYYYYQPETQSNMYLPAEQPVYMSHYVQDQQYYYQDGSNSQEGYKQDQDQMFTQPIVVADSGEYEQEQYEQQPQQYKQEQGQVYRQSEQVYEGKGKQEEVPYNYHAHQKRKTKGRKRNVSVPLVLAPEARDKLEKELNQ